MIALILEKDGVRNTVFCFHHLRSTATKSCLKNPKDLTDEIKRNVPQSTYLRVEQDHLFKAQTQFLNHRRHYHLFKLEDLHSSWKSPFKAPVTHWWWACWLSVFKWNISSEGKWKNEEYKFYLVTQGFLIGLKWSSHPFLMRLIINTPEEVFLFVPCCHRNR